MSYLKKRAYYILGTVGILLALVLITHFKHYITLEQLQHHKSWFSQLVDQHYGVAVLGFIGAYAALIVCALPVVGPFTLLGSYVFGFWPGAFYSWVSCVLGGTISFIGMRTLFSHWVKNAQNERLDSFRKKITTYGPSYLLMLHFLCVLPFFLINIVAVLGQVSLPAYLITAIIGSAPLVFIYSFAARELSHMNSMSDIFSPGILAILGVLVLLALAPIVIRRFKLLS